MKIVRSVAICSLLLLAGCKTGPSIVNTVMVANKPAVVPAASSRPACTVSAFDLLEGTSATRIDLKNSPEKYNWQRAYQKCTSSPVAAYNYAISLLDNGHWQKARELVEEASNRHPGFQPFAGLAKAIDQPMDAAVERAEKNFASWLNAESKHTFALTPPRKATPSPLPELIKGEFEKRADFEARVLRAKEKRRTELAEIELQYAGAVEQFNKEVAKYNALVNEEKQQRIADSKRMREKFLNEAVAAVFGDFTLSELVYDAELEKFTGRLSAASAMFDERVAIYVPLAGGRAQRFKHDMAELKPYLKFTVDSAGVARKKPLVYHKNVSYALEFSEEQNQLVEIRAVADVQPVTRPTISPIAKVNDTISFDEEYYREALSVQDDPTLARLRQEKAENERKLKLAFAEQVRERERKRIEREIISQQQKLADLGGSVGSEYEGLQQKTTWQFRKAQNFPRDMFAVIIGNRSYGSDIPKVHYAYNDAAAVKAFLREGLGIPPENIIYQKDATKGEMEGLFLRTLPARVTPVKPTCCFISRVMACPKRVRPCCCHQTPDLSLPILRDIPVMY